MDTEVILIDKPAGVTSFGVVARVRRVLSEKAGKKVKVGHTGTLDPLASGVLPILVGSATKLSDLFLARDKAYRAVLKLGIATDTMDITGNVTGRANGPLPGLDEVRGAAKSFLGSIWQTPPIYSAIKINGKKLYEYARENKEVKIEPRAVAIYSISCEKTDIPGEYILDIECSKGTYIRSICHDIGEKLSCGGAMAALERTRSGEFCVSGAHAPEYLETCKAERGIEGLGALLVSCGDFLGGVAQKKITLGEFYSRLAKNGAEIYMHKIKAENPGEFFLGDKILMHDHENALFALGEIREYEAGPACKPMIFI